MMARVFGSIVILFILFGATESIYVDPFASESKQATTGSTHNDLVYLVDNSDSHGALYLYKSGSQKRIPILPDWEVTGFAINKKMDIAFSSSRTGTMKPYILRVPYTRNDPVDISEGDQQSGTQFSWSPDGKYLVYSTIIEDETQLLVWDGQSTRIIFTDTGSFSELDWSSKNRLAFTLFDRNVTSSEVFVWDMDHGSINVSQNPLGEDRYPSWSRDGRLAFLSDTENGFKILIWDGTFTRSGVPEKAHFELIPSENSSYYSSPIWTSKDQVSFVGTSYEDKYAQVYLWDGKQSVNQSQYPVFHMGGQSWREDGYWAFTTFFSSGQFVFIRDSKNVTVYQGKGQYSPAWSDGGRLMFCVPGEKSWKLMVWANGEINEIATGAVIEARWSNGNEVYCTFG
jgi:Tol biopolymer transport system component